MPLDTRDLRPFHELISSRQEEARKRAISESEAKEIAKGGAEGRKAILSSQQIDKGLLKQEHEQSLAKEMMRYGLEGITQPPQQGQTPQQGQQGQPKRPASPYFFGGGTYNPQEVEQMAMRAEIMGRKGLANSIRNQGKIAEREAKAEEQLVNGIDGILGGYGSEASQRYNSTLARGQQQVGTIKSFRSTELGAVKARVAETRGYPLTQEESNAIDATLSSPQIRALPKELRIDGIKAYMSEALYGAGYPSEEDDVEAEEAIAYKSLSPEQQHVLSVTRPSVPPDADSASTTDALLAFGSGIPGVGGLTTMGKSTKEAVLAFGGKLLEFGGLSNIGVGIGKYMGKRFFAPVLREQDEEDNRYLKEAISNGEGVLSKLRATLKDIVEDVGKEIPEHLFPETVKKSPTVAKAGEVVGAVAPLFFGSIWSAGRAVSLLPRVAPMSVRTAVGAFGAVAPVVTGVVANKIGEELVKGAIGEPNTPEEARGQEAFALITGTTGLGLASRYGGPLVGRAALDAMAKKVNALKTKRAPRLAPAKGEGTVIDLTPESIDLKGFYGNTDIPMAKMVESTGNLNAMVNLSLDALQTQNELAKIAWASPESAPIYDMSSPIARKNILDSIDTATNILEGYWNSPTTHKWNGTQMVETFEELKDSVLTTAKEARADYVSASKRYTDFDVMLSTQYQDKDIPLELLDKQAQLKREVELASEYCSRAIKTSLSVTNAKVESGMLTHDSTTQALLNAYASECLLSGYPIKESEVAKLSFIDMFNKSAYPEELAEDVKSKYKFELNEKALALANKRAIIENKANEEKFNKEKALIVNYNASLPQANRLEVDNAFNASFPETNYLKHASNELAFADTVAQGYLHEGAKRKAVFKEGYSRIRERFAREYVSDNQLLDLVHTLSVFSEAIGEYANKQGVQVKSKTDRLIVSLLNEEATPKSIAEEFGKRPLTLKDLIDMKQSISDFVRYQGHELHNPSTFFFGLMRQIGDFVAKVAEEKGLTKEAKELRSLNEQYATYMDEFYNDVTRPWGLPNKKKVLSLLGNSIKSADVVRAMLKVLPNKLQQTFLRYAMQSKMAEHASKGDQLKYNQVFDQYRPLLNGEQSNTLGSLLLKQRQAVPKFVPTEYPPTLEELAEGWGEVRKGKLLNIQNLNKWLSSIAGLREGNALVAKEHNPVISLEWNRIKGAFIGERISNAIKGHKEDSGLSVATQKSVQNDVLDQIIDAENFIKRNDIREYIIEAFGEKEYKGLLEQIKYYKEEVKRKGTVRGVISLGLQRTGATGVKGQILRGIGIAIQKPPELTKEKTRLE